MMIIEVRVKLNIGVLNSKVLSTKIVPINEIQKVHDVIHEYLDELKEDKEYLISFDRGSYRTYRGRKSKKYYAVTRLNEEWDKVIMSCNIESNIISEIFPNLYDWEFDSVQSVHEFFSNNELII